MATKKSKPQSRSRRNSPPPAAPPLNLTALHELIAQERERLTDAEAVLDCVSFAMGDDVRLDAPGPSYANVVRMVRGLVSTSIDQLDSVYVKAAVNAPADRGNALDETSTMDNYSGVKEPAPLYVH